MKNTPKITVLEPSIGTAVLDYGFRRPTLRVAAYARVSTEQDEQQSSYEAQMDYYTWYIQNNPDWEFVEVYAEKSVIVGIKSRRLLRHKALLV